MSAWAIRTAASADLARADGDLQPHIEHTSVTFDLRPFTPEERQGWLDEHATAGGRIRLLVAADANGQVAGYATTSRFRPKAAYDTTVEASVYCSPTHVGQVSVPSLQRALSSHCRRRHQPDCGGRDVVRPAASLALHRRFGFTEVGVFSSVGRKFDCYWDVIWLERGLDGD